MIIGLLVSIILGGSVLAIVYFHFLGKAYDRLLVDPRFRKRYLAVLAVLGSAYSFGTAYLNHRNHVTLLREVRPVYPALAIQARIQGKVRFNAVINTDGQVETLTLISGHPLLIPAAKDAIFQWQYSHPASSVHTVIEINFALGPRSHLPDH